MKTTQQLLKLCQQISIVLITSIFTSNLYAQVGDIFSDESEVYRFELPSGIFFKTRENYFTSKSLSASIKFHSESNYIGDEIFNADIESQFKIAQKGLKVTYQNIRKNNFTISGIDQNGNIVYIRADSEMLVTRSNPDYPDELSWKWTKTMIVSFTYPPASKKAMDTIIAKFLKSYKVNLWEL